MSFHFSAPPTLKPQLLPGPSKYRRVTDIPPLQEYVSRYATKDAIDEAGAESDDDDDMSSVASFGSDDNEEAAGQMEEI